MSQIFGFSVVRRNSKMQKKKKKPQNWFEGCTVAQLKELCKAVKLPASGTKPVLVQLLLDSEASHQLSQHRQVDLKRRLKEQCLVQSGNKYDLILRLLQAQFNSGNVKRAATEMTVGPGTGQAVPVLKKRKVNPPTPKAMYRKVAQKMKAVTQKKYQSHYGSKNHSPAVYGLMKSLIKDHCIAQENDTITNGLIETNPKLAEEMARNVFHAFDDHWPVMKRTGYETCDFREALDLYGTVLQAAQLQLSKDDVATIVSLLESVEASVGGYCLANRLAEDACVYYTTGGGRDASHLSAKDRARYGVNRHEDENVIQSTIRLIMPDYNKENRSKKQGKPLNCDLLGWSNMIITTMP